MVRGLRQSASKKVVLISPRQEFIETTFPAHPARENSKKLSAAEKSNGVDKKANEADKKSKDATSRDGALSYKNTAIKFLLDQTLGATVNTLLYSTFIRSLRAATAHAPPAMSFVKAVDWWMAAGAVDFSAVNFHQVWLAAQDEFWPIVTAGWRLWPFVSLINFTLIKSVQGRNLFGAVAGVAWGIYICIATAD